VLEDQVVIVTGASQGIGKSIAKSFSDCGIRLCVGSRRPEKLKEIFSGFFTEDSLFIKHLDLGNPKSIDDFIAGVYNKFGDIDILIHSGGQFQTGRIEETSPGRVSDLLLANVQGTHHLLGTFLSHRNKDFSQVIVINSSTAIESNAEAGVFAATTHGIKALTDAFRDENNKNSVRVTSLFLGRVATPRMEDLYRKNEEIYQKELLLQPGDIANTVLNIVTMPKNSEMTDVHLRPFIKSY
jgi:NADP-dependent 3-hydroxy acid dehydrogenase YdfG